jgi:hypothetical protein
MSDKNVCPYCGGNKLQAERYDKYNNKKVPHQPNVGYRGRCNDCGRDGPWIQAEDDDGYWYYAGWELAQQAAINAFCHPAHLHTYDPETQVVISREAGKQIKTCVGYYLYDENGHCDSDSRCVDAYRELCAAMEATHERDE